MHRILTVLLVFVLLAITGSVAFAQGGTWATVAPLPTPQNRLAAGAIGGIVYAVGGEQGSPGPVGTLYAYDPVTDTWTTKTPMPTPRRLLGAAVVGGKLYAIGGHNSGGFQATVEAYDPGTDTWITRAPMPTPRFGLGVVAANGMIFAVGGGNSSGQLTTVEAYDPATDTWSTKAPMPTGRAVLAVAAVGGVIYVVGGFTPGIVPNPDVLAYDIATDTWTSKAPLPTPRNELSAASVDGILYAVGGDDGTNIFSTVEAYNPTTNTWTTKTPMPTARTQMSVAVTGGRLYAMGGFGPGVTFFDTVEVFTPPVLAINIDIKPGSDPNSINLSSAGTIPVALLSSASFDALTVDPDTISLAGARVKMVGKSNRSLCHGEDINGDGRNDLVCHVETAQFMIEEGETLAVLEARTFDGRAVRGEDGVRIVPDE